MKTKIFLFLFFCGILFVPIMPEILDSYDESHQDTTYALFAGSTITYGQAFSAIVNCTLDHAVFFLKKNGAPTGYVIARVYASTGTFGSSAKPTGPALAVSDNVNISTITGTYALTTFNFSGANRVNLTTGVKYIVVVSYSGGDGSNNLNVGADNVDSVAPGNACYSVDNINWTALSATDVCFYVYVVSAINTKATTWGWLSKSQLDPTTVDQAIALAIAAHESDPTAHLGAGESIEMHRTNEVLDHPQQSVVVDKAKYSIYDEGPAPIQGHGWTADAGVISGTGTRNLYFLLYSQSSVVAHEDLPMYSALLYPDADLLLRFQLGMNGAQSSDGFAEVVFHHYDGPAYHGCISFAKVGTDYLMRFYYDNNLVDSYTLQSGGELRKQIALFYNYAEQKIDLFISGVLVHTYIPAFFSEFIPYQVRADGTRTTNTALEVSLFLWGAKYTLY